MSSYRSRGVDRATAERLLAGNPAVAGAPVAAVLRAATAPTDPKELVEEGAVAAAFRAAAHLEPVPEPRRPSMLKSILAKGLLVKVAIVLAATGSTGVVLAASSGDLPWSDTPVSTPAASHSATPSTPPSVTPTGRPSDAGKPADAGTSASPSVLCHAYEAEVKENPGKALKSTAFTALSIAAGGKDKIDAYCDAAAVTTEHPTGQPSDLPTPTAPGSSDARPTEPGRTHAPVSPAPSAVTPSGVPTPPKGH